MNNLAQQQMQMANQNMGQQQPSNNSMLEEWKAKNNFNQNQVSTKDYTVNKEWRFSRFFSASITLK